MRRGHSAKLLLVWIAVFSTALVAGKLEPSGQIGSAAAPSGALRAPVTGDETAAPVLNPAIYHHVAQVIWVCLLYTSPSPRDLSTSRMPSSA